MKKTILITLFLAVLLPPCLDAQPGKITGEPVTLREIWRVRGSAWFQYVGSGVAGLSDVNGDSIGDFAVTGPTGWNIYYGARVMNDTVRALLWSRYGNLSVVGDFWGTGHKAFGLPRDSVNQNNVPFDAYAFFRTDSNRMDTIPEVIISTHIQACSHVLLAADLDKDGADEFFLVCGCGHPEIWIYKGGPNFPGGDAPAVKIIDPDYNTQDPYYSYYAAVADFDGDSWPDLVTGCHYDTGSKLKFYFGSASAPFSWSVADRRIELSTTEDAAFGYGFTISDYDGDGVMDLAARGPGGKVYIYRSRVNGKNARSRSYLLDDADNVISVPGFTGPVRVGYLNDSARRFEMLGLLGSSGAGAELRVYSCGPNGPGSALDASYRDGLDNVFGLASNIGPIRDCNNDGWSDFITSDPRWWSPSDQGIALILAGGAYIPRNDPTLGVRDLTAEGKHDAVSLWPNPARDVLHVAWRGDLVAMPRRFFIHDMAGAVVAFGDVEPGTGAARWNCADTPAGAYLLSIHAGNGSLIATTRFVKE